MGEFDPKFTRLKIFLIIFVFLFFIVSCEFVFFGMSDNSDIVENIEIKQSKPPTDLWGLIWEGIGAIADGIIGFFSAVIQYMTFSFPNVDLWMQLIMAPIMIILTTIEGYMIVDVIYSLVKALPTT